MLVCEECVGGFEVEAVKEVFGVDSFFVVFVFAKFSHTVFLSL